MGLELLFSLSLSLAIIVQCKRAVTTISNPSVGANEVMNIQHLALCSGMLVANIITINNINLQFPNYYKMLRSFLQLKQWLADHTHQII